MPHKLYPFALALTLGLAACGAPPQTATRLGASVSPAQSERILSESEHERYAARDTDELTDDPLSEEGLWPSPPPGDLGNFGEVNDRLFRGARPTEKGMQMLKEKGVSLIVNLENDKKAVTTERLLAQKYGIGFKSIPMGIFLPPKLAKIDEFLALAQNPASGKIYFHCMQGRDRTGTMAFCYRVKADRWTTDKAYAEMKSYHFHKYLLGLNAFVHWYGAKYGPGSAASAPKQPEPAALAAF
ncbi:MAG: dual specificity protein phosphatase family protein [Candidatus Sericytochromatia bacterium]|nr:dual specificity protein phosphatase family protein [Candidatus Tanganyikabacteria bacterium]